MKALLLTLGLLLLFAVEILRVYLIMPFPGSQQSDTINIAYWLHNNMWWLRIIGLLLIAYPAVQVMRYAKAWKKVLLVVGLALYGVVFYFFNFSFLADKMFYQPAYTRFADAADNKVAADKLVIGVVINGEAKAYPIQLIGYHHQVRDTIAGTPVMVTYCTVCRTGRVFSPLVDGRLETFRLVGMDHFNAMFEDAVTKSWWRQATGVAVAGPLKGKKLAEIPAAQLPLRTWLRDYPGSVVFQGDTSFTKQYEHLDLFDKGTIASDLEKRDSGSWQMKSWVVGVLHGGQAKAYDWNELVNKRIIQDSLAGLPLLLVMERDKVSYHVWNRQINGNSLQFDRYDISYLKDLNTLSLWDMTGLCIDGPLKGEQLLPLQAYQEFWHSWNTFHPGTERHP